MPPGRLGSALAALTKQKIISAKVIDVLGKTCSVRLSGTGSRLTAIPYIGLQPSVGDTVMVDYRGGNPIALVTTDAIPADIKKLTSKKVGVMIQPKQVITYVPTFQWTRQTLALPDFWHSVCWARALRLFVAVGQGSSSSYPTDTYAMTSPDGETWTPRTVTGLINGHLACVCWSQELSLLVAGVVTSSGTTPVVYISPDGGTTWNSVVSGNGYGYSGVCWSKELGIFVMVGNHTVGQDGSKCMLTSTNGTTWVPHNIPSPIDHYWHSVCWSAKLGLFVATGHTYGGKTRGYNVITSPDGVSWTLRQNFVVDANWWNSVCWSPQLELFVGLNQYGTSANRIMTSVDGINWTLSTAPTNTANTSMNSVCWSEELEMFIAVGQYNTDAGGYQGVTITSKDGLTWELLAESPEGRMNSVVWASEIKKSVAVGGNWPDEFSSVWTGVLQ